ncbi:hypothetical protein [Sinanaerobacter chloroacetimidivorans]|uniref:Uncharacterized protein n=1 Tax=Sinanaerobacter chloroacetimidivorans TaxID=2818044 RepID=A0A8J7W0P3_9FIRM|nr:hypothetical protein [Sinanaerobacter chloroacetimidivorans]MBR0597078.1 hypothetical protein [Sinanaerobacter chloroacetimidivorans]
MKRHRKTGHYLPARVRSSLCQTCGTNVDIENIDFTNNQSNLVYMDKVFSFNEDTSCPLLFNLNTGGRNTDEFTVELTLCSKTNSLIPCTLSPNAVFNIENSFVVVEYFNTRPPGNINASQVTVDGETVDAVKYANGQYTATTANVLSEVQKQRCLNRNLPTKVFFLITNAGPWDFRARFVLEGTVNTDGRNCCFRAEIFNTPGTSNTSLPPGSLSSFAIPNLSLPCSIDGISPDILFQFNANISLVNPRLVVRDTSRHHKPRVAGADAEFANSCCPPPCPPCPDVEALSVSLISTLAIEPTVHVQTVRRTLFCVNACEALQPCQGNVLAAEEEEEEDCDLFGPDCRCGRPRPLLEDVAGETIVDRIRDRKCDNDWRDFRKGCGGFDVGGVTVGAGDCDDCENIEDLRIRRDDRKKHDDVRGIRDDRFCRDKVLSDICDDLLDDRDCDCDGAVRGLGTDGTFGCDCDGDVRGIRTKCDCDGGRVAGARTSPKVRTAFQFNGCNGCSW